VSVKRSQCNGAHWWCREIGWTVDERNFLKMFLTFLLNALRFNLMITNKHTLS
jgi:hypothetical protein